LPGQRATLQALVPLAEVSEYQSRLKALTGGQGAYTMELSHYDPVPPRKQQELAQAWKPRAEEERSEERRVGKEWGWRGGRRAEKKNKSRERKDESRREESSVARVE